VSGGVSGLWACGRRGELAGETPRETLHLQGWDSSMTPSSIANNAAVQPAVNRVHFRSAHNVMRAHALHMIESDVKVRVSDEATQSCKRTPCTRLYTMSCTRDIVHDIVYSPRLRLLSCALSTYASTSSISIATSRSTALARAHDHKFDIDSDRVYT